MAYEGPQIKLFGLTANADLSARNKLLRQARWRGLVDVCSASPTFRSACCRTTR